MKVNSPLIAHGDIFILAVTVDCLKTLDVMSLVMSLIIWNTKQVFPVGPAKMHVKGA